MREMITERCISNLGSVHLIVDPRISNSSDGFCVHASQTCHDLRPCYRLCEAQNCKKIPAFGDPRSGSPRFCREHKLAFHVDVKNKKHPTEGSYVAR
mmetsp:Transcript_27860/g.63018  ORF Transcript_27860/g.63018 Transcript_27860/m.63018 type:complete len:97 (+) Transcript_27860:531-821(+)